MQQRSEHYYRILRLHLLLRTNHPLRRPDISSICHQNQLAAVPSGAVEFRMPCSELVETLPERYFEMWNIFGLVSVSMLLTSQSVLLPMMRIMTDAYSIPG